MSEYRAPRVWHIENRYGYFYATCQYGGFRRFRSEQAARDAIEQDIAEYGDRWAA